MTGTVARRPGRVPAAVVSAALLAAAVAGCEKDTAAGRNAGGEVRYPTKTVQLMVPAAPGGGWDLTARTMQKAMTDGKLVEQPVEVYNVTGAAGTVGLAQLVSKNSGDPHHLMVMGLVMVGGVVANKSPVKLDQVTPIATLTAEQEVIVVPAASKYRTLKQLMDDAKADPASVNWGGGSAGGTDQILVGLLAKAAGADPKAMKYVAYSGGGESKAALLSGDLTAAVSGQSEFADLVASGKVRALAVSGATGIDVGGGSPAPTIKQQGYDVELMNWRGVVAPPGLDEPTRQAVTGLVDRLHSSDAWRAVLQQQGWEDFYRSGDDAAAYFAAENQRITAVLTDIGLG
ncbi:Bug family tripartite tricarboxylate transporter substrate binding protein [Jidongwangia harbinensis]|uniref:Bug family tripartite tricarboxylate transporter substrate binding protein n=1 Tax=Jidongwangia harbinensis TaxID=2878561 RepID=UPI001CDA3332|nr:tripartite tricarboxylate transporter substrate binding protein [Jidongwangia harbinensis]MCA2211851.1 tripartite tricarboxylate transporter substrate binding protein [Jidongwangia harbinensis]